MLKYDQMCVLMQVRGMSSHSSCCDFCCDVAGMSRPKWRTNYRTRSPTRLDLEDCGVVFSLLPRSESLLLVRPPAGSLLWLQRWNRLWRTEIREIVVLVWCLLFCCLLCVCSFHIAVQESMETLLTPKKSIDVVLCLVCLVSLFEWTTLCLGALVWLSCEQRWPRRTRGAYLWLNLLRQQNLLWFETWPFDARCTPLFFLEWTVLASPPTWPRQCWGRELERWNV